MHSNIYLGTCSYPYHLNMTKSWNDLNIPLWQYGDKHYGSLIWYVKILKKSGFLGIANPMENFIIVSFFPLQKAQENMTYM